MLIWILAISLFVIVGALGYYQGAVRLAVSLVGLILGVFLAFPLAPYLAPLVKLAGVTHPVWSFVLPPMVVFLLVLLMFMGVAWFVHRKVELFYKYRTDDVTRLRWERMNQGLGLGLGAVMATVWLLLLGWIVYVVGHVTVQVATEDTDATPIRLLNQAKRDLHATGLAKLVAGFDRIPKTYYEASDVVGLVYNNPILLGRLSTYPPFLSLAERTEFQEIATDTEYNNMLLSKADIRQILNHPKTVAILQNKEILDYVRQQDLKDLRQYLETGVSPKYSEETLLGRWEVDPYATLIQIRKKNPEMSASEMTRLKKVVREYLSSVTFVATVDHKAVLKSSVSPDVLNPPAQAQTPAPETAPAPNPYGGMSPELARRYNLAPGQSPGAPPVQRPAAPAPKPADNLPDLNIAAQGTWERESGERYKLKVQTEKGSQRTLQAQTEGDRLTIEGGPFTLVFNKVEA